MEQQNAGQLRGIVEFPMDVVRSAGNITNDIASGLGQIIGATTAGVGEIADAAGRTLDSLSKTAKVTSVKVVDRVGELAPNAADKLGKVVKVVPILGKPAAYVVKGAGRGVYYVVTSVGDIAGEGIRGVGKAGKVASDLVVFTLGSAGSTTKKVIDEAGEIVKKVSHDIAGKKKSAKKHAKTMKKKAAKKANHTRKHK
jgi:alkylated DNA nucleotide flippase Atl1